MAWIVSNIINRTTSGHGSNLSRHRINPGIADPVAADKRSIKAVLSLTGAKATVELKT